MGQQNEISQINDGVLICKTSESEGGGWGGGGVRSLNIVLTQCDIWPFISIMNVWLSIEWCGIDGVYK